MVINKFYVLDEHFFMLDLFYWHADCCYLADSLADPGTEYFIQGRHVNEFKWSYLDGYHQWKYHISKTN